MYLTALTDVLQTKPQGHFGTMNITASGTTNATQQCVTIHTSSSDFLAYVYILAFILGLVFNLLTLGPIWQQVRQQNILGIFLLSLSVSDMCFIFTMPLWINYYWQNHQWKLGSTSCSIAGFFFYSNMYISILLLCCISVDRCLVVTHPLRSKTRRTSCYAWAQCVAVYVVVVVLHIMVLFNDTHTDARDAVNGGDRCYEAYPLERPVALFNMIRVAAGFLLPLLVLAVSYWRVLATVGQSPGLTPQVKRKVRLLSWGVIGIFSVCFAPYHIMLLARSLVFYRSGDTAAGGSYCRFEQGAHSFFSWALGLSSLNCVVDPVLYVLVSNRGQEEARLFCRRRKRSLMESSAAAASNRGKPNNNLI